MEAPDAPPPLSFVEELAAAACTPGLRKGDRTRALLRHACAVALHERPAALLSVDDVAARAGVSRTTLYQYYPDRAALAAEVLRDFQRGMLGKIGGPRRGADLFDAILATNLHYVAFYEANAPLMERVREAGAEMPELLSERQDTNRRWAARLLAAVERRRGAPADGSLLLLKLHALEGTADDLLRERFTVGNPDIVRLAPDHATLARALTEIWYDALFRSG